MKGRFQGNLELSDLVAPRVYRLKLDGSGPAGFLRGGGTVGSSSRPAIRRASRYDVDAQVGGKIAAVGQRLVESSARALARQGLEGLEAELVARSAAAAGSEAGTATVSPRPLPPSTTAFAARFARGLWSELPRSLRIAITVLTVAVLAGLILLLRSC